MLNRVHVNVPVGKLLSRVLGKGAGTVLYVLLARRFNILGDKPQLLAILLVVPCFCVQACELLAGDRRKYLF